MFLTLQNTTAPAAVVTDHRDHLPRDRCAITGRTIRSQQASLNNGPTDPKPSYNEPPPPAYEMMTGAIVKIDDNYHYFGLTERCAVGSPSRVKLLCSAFSILHPQNELDA